MLRAEGLWDNQGCPLPPKAPGLTGEPERAEWQGDDTQRPPGRSIHQVVRVWLSRPPLALSPTHSCLTISLAIISFDILPFLTLVQLVTLHSFLLSGPLCLTFRGFWACWVKLWSYLQGHMRGRAIDIQDHRTRSRRPASSLRPFLGVLIPTESLLFCTPRGTVYSSFFDA